MNVALAIFIIACLVMAWEIERDPLLSPRGRFWFPAFFYLVACVALAMVLGLE